MHLGTALFALSSALGTSVSFTAWGPQDPRPDEKRGDGLWDAARDVIEKRCLGCHGGERVKSGLRFSDFETFRRGGNRGPVVNTTTPDSSRLLEVIGYENPELAMPPGGQLQAHEIDALQRWVLGGAPWPEDPLSGQLANPALFQQEQHSPNAFDDARDWWAYLPLVPPEVPSVANAHWSQHPIDAFIESRRQRENIQAAEPASPETLLRRATYDLLGLPPTIEQQDAFATRIAAIGLDAAWNELVERLLESPHYGEHWGRHWLDLVRYADTNGYERDGTKRNAWRYRDWVIRSLNADKPYDRFTIEQLAGDELALADQAKHDNEGLTEEQAEAILGTGYFRLGVWDDEPSDPKQALADELADIVDTTGQVFLGTTVGCARCHDHKADPIRQSDYYALTAFFNNLKSYGGGAFGQHLGAGMHRDLADAAGQGVLGPEARDEYVRELDEALLGYAERLDIALPSDTPTQERVLVADARQADTATGSATWKYLEGESPLGWHTPGFDDSEWVEGHGGFGTAFTPGSKVGTEWKSKRIQLRTRFRLTEIPAHVALSFHHDEDVSIYLNGQEILARGGHRSDYTEIQLDGEARQHLVVGSNLLAVVCRQTGGGQFIDVGLRVGLSQKPKADWLQELQKKIRAQPDHPDAGAVRALAGRRERAYASPSTTPYPALIAAEYGVEAPQQHILLRGSVHAPADPVEANVPLVFRASSPTDFSATETLESSTGRRLAFARWLFDEGKFLTARVMANRLWQFHFGRGLCASPGDFGRLGVEPTHPLLLDHLAAQLIDRKWSLKAMHRYLMASRTYRMSSVGSQTAHTLDPRNNLYWRFDPQRLTAEQYRDGVLATNASLNKELFGPSVFPTLAREVLATASRPHDAWRYSPPEQEVRRSIYVFVKRSLRPPLLESLDQPDPDLPCPARFQTNVPTQALITMNGAFVNQNAERLAERLLQTDPDLEQAIALGIRLALGRRPEPDELARNVTFVNELRHRHDQTTNAALAVFCLNLYNRNEFLWLD